jgi:hypothetical protein
MEQNNRTQSKLISEYWMQIDKGNEKNCTSNGVFVGRKMVSDAKSTDEVIAVSSLLWSRVTNRGE